MPVGYLMLSQAKMVSFILMGVFVLLTVYFVASGVKSGDRVQPDRYIAMLLLFWP